MRKIIEINNNWKYVKHASDSSEAFKSNGESITLPHTWNAVDGQDGGNDYYRGTCWYTHKLEIPEIKDERVYLEFDGVAMSADVYVNNHHLTHHEGGYSTFRVDITDTLNDENELCIAVDNSSNHVYPQTADFTFYGGIYRSVKLIVVPSVHFDLGYVGSKGLKVTPLVKGDDAEVTVEVWVKGNPDKVNIKVDNLSREVEVKDGYATTTLVINHVHLWDGTNDPFMYDAIATLESGDSVHTKFGCRTYEIDAQKGFILNGRSYPLRGVSRHQDYAGVGNALTLDMHKQDMELIKEIGANTVRLAHYQHAQEFYDLCDENGIVVWAEIPYITMHMKNGRANTLSQMEELVVQNYHHPSIVVWGLSNEITAAGIVNDDLLENHRLLNDLCHKLDKTRLTTMANVFMLETSNPIIDIPDVNSYNLYFGWYLGELVQNDEFFDEFHEKYPDKPIGFSEYGADANPQYQSSNPERGDYSETYQAVYHEHIINMINERPWIWATHVWNMFDFAADGRDEGGKHGENQKGLITMDRKLKKDAFYLYKAHWNKTDKFVHIGGSRYIDRIEDTTLIKVYSNLDEVSLYVDGNLYETKQGKCVFNFEVNISGKHVVEAKAQEYSSKININKVDEVNTDYLFNKDKDVRNWFDNDDFKPDHYSISDTLGELSQNEEANQIVQALMNQASASRGDVAEQVKDNPELQRMMARQTLVSMLKHASDSITQEQVEALNRALQKIKK